MGIKIDSRYQQESLNKYLGQGTYLKNAQEIEKWCRSTFEGKKLWERRLPSSIAKDEYEKKLGVKLHHIRQNVLKKYEGKELGEIKDKEDRKIVEIIRRLDKEYKIPAQDKKKIKKQEEKYGTKTDLKNVQEIEEWCKTTFEGKKVWERRTPRETAKDEYEKKLGQKLAGIRQKVLKQHEGKKLEEIKDEEDRKIVEIIRTLDKEYGMKADLKNVQEIEEWCKTTFEGKKVWERRTPSETAKNEYEKKLGKRLNNVRQNILKKYEGKEIEEIEDEEDRKIVETIRTLDKEYGMKADLKNAQEIEEWCISTFEGKKVWERR